MAQTYDIIILGGGIAGLFVANRLRQAGYNLILIEKDKLGGGQTLASQGMIHGGQKYALQGKVTAQAINIAEMPERWDACFAGNGEIDLSEVKSLSETQVMFPAQKPSWFSFISRMTVFAAAKAVNGKTKKLRRALAPAVPRGPVYEMQEKVLDTKSLVSVLTRNLEGRVFHGEATTSAKGEVFINGIQLQAAIVIYAAGSGNERALNRLDTHGQRTQLRPLRQIMVKSMPYPLYGHGIVGNPKPRVTITSHPDNAGGYIWYLGGNVAEESAKLSETEALAFAKKEMQEIFPAIDWSNKEWASWYGERAEAFSADNHLPTGPHLHACGRTLFTWPTKMTFAPALADSILRWLEQSKIAPSAETAPPDLPAAEIGPYPWEAAAWLRL